MSKSHRIQRQAIDIAYNIVLAQIAVATIQTRHCALIRREISQIFSKASGETIMEEQAARLFDALGRDKQLLVLSTALAGITTVTSMGQEWTIFDNPLMLKIDSLDIRRARLLYFQWQGLADPEGSPLKFLYDHWLVDVVPVRRPNICSTPRMAISHA